MNLPSFFLLATLGALTASGLHPKERLTWWMEIAPILIWTPWLIATYRRFTFSNRAYFAFFLHGLILMVGGRYTYAEVPFGYWLQDLLHLSRNPYDRLGHLAQGFFPALILREYLERKGVFARLAWIPFFTVAACLAFSALYELIEWWAALSLGQSADAFLGTQGDPWDTQWDMFTALVGALLAQLCFWRRSPPSPIYAESNLSINKNHDRHQP
jgi:putative membrane protein